MESMKLSKVNLSLAAVGVGLGLLLSVTDACARGYKDEGYNQISMPEHWAGAYFGAYFGAGGGNSHTNLSSTQDFTSTSILATSTTTTAGSRESSGRMSGKSTGSVADLFVGYNFHQPCANFLFGAQVEGSFFNDISYKSIGSSVGTGSQATTIVTANGTTVISATSGEDGTTEFSDELHSMVKLVARGGYLFNPCTMFYVLAGGVEGNFVVPDDDNPFGGRRSKWEAGYTLGAGVEYTFGNHWSVRGEYRYLRFNNIDRNRSSFSDSISTNPTGVFTTSSTFNQKTHSNLDFNMGEVGIVYSFV